MSNKSGVDLELHRLSLLISAGYFIGLHIRYASPLMQFSTYPQTWLDHYTENAYALRDPTIAWGFSTEGAARWSEMEIPDPFGIFTEAAEFGLVYGVTVSCGPVSSRTISSFARDDREFRDEEIEEIERSVRRLHHMTEPPESLTEAQIEAFPAHIPADDVGESGIRRQAGCGYCARRGSRHDGLNGTP